MKGDEGVGLAARNGFRGGFDPVWRDLVGRRTGDSRRWRAG